MTITMRHDMNLYLGLIYKKQIDYSYRLINHRSVLKILLNPILRIFGIMISSIYDKESDKITGLKIVRCPFQLNIIDNYKNSIFYNLQPNTKIKKYRVWF